MRGGGNALGVSVVEIGVQAIDLHGDVTEVELDDPAQVIAAEAAQLIENSRVERLHDSDVGANGVFL